MWQKWHLQAEQYMEEIKKIDAEKERDNISAEQRCKRARLKVDIDKVL